MDSQLIGAVLVIVAGLVALFYKGKADNVSAEAIEAKVEVKDAPLAAKQEETKEQIKEVDAGIQQMKDEREKLRNQYITDQQRADSWNDKSKQ